MCTKEDVKEAIDEAFEKAQYVTQIDCVRRCNEITINEKSIQKDLKNACSKQDLILEDIKELRAEIKDTYAGKWTEGAIKWVAILIIGAVIASLLNQVLK